MTLGQAVVSYISKAQTPKEKIDELVFNIIKNFIASKETVKKVKRQPTE